MKKILSIFSLLLLLGVFSCTDTTTVTTTESATTTEAEQLSFLDSLSNPFNIGLFVTEDLTTSIGINFEMPSSMVSYIEYGETSSDQTQRIEATEKTVTFDDDFVYLYEVTLSGLTENTSYKYRVTNDDSSVVSEFYTFDTLESGKSEYSFMFLADQQENTELGYMAYAYTVNSVLEETEKDIELMMLPGDVINDSDIQSQWNWLYQYSSMFSTSIPMAVTLGNHEMIDVTDDIVASLEFDGYMNLPNNGPTYGAFNVIDNDKRTSNFDDGKTYSFDYGDAHITVINTEVFCDGTTACSATDQNNVAVLENWLIQDLSNSTAAWKIVMLHRGPYSLSYDTHQVRDSLAPIFDDYGVNLVLAGHDHQYSRAIYSDDLLVPFSASYEYVYGEVMLTEDATNTNDLSNYSTALGVTYLTSNTTATKFYGGVKNSFIEVNYKFQDKYPVIPVITVTETEIRVTSYAIVKDSAFAVIPEEIVILEEFVITN